MCHAGDNPVMRTPLVLFLLLLCALATAPAASAAGDPLRPQQWGLDMIEADAAHVTSTGSGAVVAVIDTGVDFSHEDLADRLVAGYDFVSGDSTPEDQNGHGTHVTGIVAADAGNGKGIEGVAPTAKVMPIRVLDENGDGTTDDVTKGIDYAVAHHADVINLSLGGNVVSVVAGDDPKFTAAIERAIGAGVVVVAAAGNDSLPICEQPSTQGKLLCVGSVDRRGMRSYFSSSGDLMAPGGSNLGGSDEDILSTWNDGGYEAIAGTSQATPHVSGVAALLVSLGLHGRQVVDRIVSTVSPGGIGVPGILNAKNAVAGLSAGGGGGGAGGGGEGGGGTGGAGSSGGKATISFRRAQSIRAVLRHGVRVRCRAPQAGRCAVTVTARGKTIARGSHRIGAGETVTVSAKVTRAGRRILRRAKRLKASLRADVPGATERFKRALTVVT